MCGIFGTLNPDGLTSDDKEKFSKFFNYQQHRGPDGSGEYISEKIAVGMVRLSIIDTLHGWQPIWNENKTIGVVANGEIYNYIELRNDLVNKNHSFSTQSDIETLVHLYEEYGLDFVKHLRGMFAVALIDLEKGRLILARDRLGEKPLYVATINGRTIFSSELRSLIQSGIVPLDFDSGVLASYFQYSFVPEPYTLIKNVRKVEAGTLEIISFATNDFEIQRYWDLDSQTSSRELFPAQELRQIIDEVGQLVVRSDVPIGIALSSGLDSSIIAALTKRMGLDVHSFTVGYSGSHQSDESVAAVKLAHSMGLTPHVVILDPLTVAKNFRDLCLQRDEPIADIAGAGYLAVSELAKSKGIKVLLNGQGADELFWGYEWVRKIVHSGNRRAQLLAGKRNYFDYLRISPLPHQRGPLLDWVKSGGGLFENLAELFEDFSAKRNNDLEVLVFKRRPRARKIKRISRKLIKNHESKRGYSQESCEKDLDVSDKVLKTLIETYLKSNGLGQMDRLSMATSVEARSPFVDYKIVEFAVRECGKANRVTLPSKSILIEAVNDLVPDNIKKQKKKGFTPPMRDWYKAIHETHATQFNAPRMVELGLVDKKAVKILNHPLSLIGRPSVLWLELAVLEMWIIGLEKIAGSTNIHLSPNS